MNASIKKIVIFALVLLFLSWETSAASIGEPEPTEVVEAEGGEAVEGLEDGEGTEVEDLNVFKVPPTYRCGDLKCPNGAFCEIKQKPDFVEKKVTTTTRCRGVDGTVLVEETTTEDIPDGEIPFTSVARKIVKGDNHGAYFGSSYAGSFKSGNLGGRDEANSVGFEPFDVNKLRGFGSYYNDIMSKTRQILQATSDLVRDVNFSRRWFW